MYVSEKVKALPWLADLSHHITPYAIHMSLCNPSLIMTVFN